MQDTDETAAGTVRERRHEQTKREIVSAAWALAERTGIAGLSFREVAREVGMQAPSLYTYFSSKDALFDHMFAEGYRQLGAATARWAPTDDPADAEQTLAVVIANWIRFCQASLARYQLMFTRALPGWEPSPDAYQASVDEFETMVAALAPLGIARESDIDMFTAMVSGLAAQQIANDPTGDRWVRLAPQAARMIVGATQGRKP